ncbi:prepilin-type N-terminal cleavage/methylation domain-containing protein [Candidatus Gracilibacteria bacterium]|nr:prepilin-type N-terminal cleavage/methylation domain-containing protein [Candidatus Gracilibacteria bacterium]MCF7856050.1 prepilin-type N-terminal cleavage/methylation domain-containing protein [Candidatus Gracilibacteria bacterium]MCF7896395.1 prepilin-type N-terminal cleavage/methylation domain-containing protein [Candidatus Gracilibacteria bacterium]
MKPILKSRRGETLIEVLVAIIILVVGALSAVKLLGLASINSQLTKERVIATNLSREGLEAVRNIRDTNWLRFGGERRLCWNNIDVSECVDTDDGDGVTDDPIVHEQNYIVKFDTGTFRWELEEVSTGELDLSDELADNTAYRLETGSNGLYNHIDDTPDDPADDTIYFRQIYTEYLNDDQTQDATTNASNNILRVTSKVEWMDRGRISDVTLTTILTDYLGRKNHD